jgi:hypothetical protein
MTALRLYTDGRLRRPGRRGRVGLDPRQRAARSLRLGQDARPVDPSAVRADRGGATPRTGWPARRQFWRHVPGHRPKKDTSDDAHYNREVDALAVEARRGK